MTEDEKSRPGGGGFRNTLTPDSTAFTAEQADALKIARALIEGGVPVFAAPPVPGKPGEYQLPSGWDKTVPSMTWLQKWRPGWALAAVGGHVADFLDVDPRNGGDASLAEIERADEMPRVFGVQATPSGGRHFVISPLHEAKSPGFMPGLDYQGGSPDGKGRAFVYIAPTVRPSKAPETLGELAAYEWIQDPDLDYLEDFDSDDSIEGLRGRIHAKRAKSTNQKYEGERRFTQGQAENFIQPMIDRLEQAQIGHIEESANALACMLSRFVPDFWNVETAFAVIANALSKTAYDPNRPGATWTAEDKCLPTLRHEGNRAPSDWKAILVEQTAETTAPAERKTSLKDRLLNLEQLRALPRSKPLIKGVLEMNSAAWLIGQPGGFKSFVALDWACHVATGLTWAGKHQTTRGDVIYVVAEGTRSFANRVDAWAKRRGVQPDRLFILPVAVQARGKDKTVSEDWKELVELVREVKPALVVLDTQARLTVGMEENSNTEMGVWIQAVDMVKEAAEGCVLVVHHTGRADGDARGANALDGAQDTEWKVSRKPHELKCTLKMDKNKDGDDSLKYVFAMDVMELGYDPEGARITSLAIGERDEKAEHRTVMTQAELTADEARSLSNRAFIERALEELGTPGIGLTRAEIKRTVWAWQEAAKVEKTSENTLKSAIARGIEGNWLTPLGASKVGLPAWDMGDE